MSVDIIYTQPGGCTCWFILVLFGARDTVFKSRGFGLLCVAIKLCLLRISILDMKYDY